VINRRQTPNRISREFQTHDSYPAYTVFPMEMSWPSLIVRSDTLPTTLLARSVPFFSITMIYGNSKITQIDSHYVSPNCKQSASTSGGTSFHLKGSKMQRNLPRSSEKPRNAGEKDAEMRYRRQTIKTKECRSQCLLL
jgi:hypothetical protein